MRGSRREKTVKLRKFRLACIEGMEVVPAWCSICREYDCPTIGSVRGFVVIWCMQRERRAVPGGSGSISGFREVFHIGCMC